MEKPKPTYLGDSVYADYSSGQLQIYTNNGEGDNNEIFIDSDVLTNLFKYVETSLAVKITIKPKEL